MKSYRKSSTKERIDYWENSEVVTHILKTNQEKTAFITRATWAKYQKEVGGKKPFPIKKK